MSSAILEQAFFEVIVGRITTKDRYFIENHRVTPKEQVERIKRGVPGSVLRSVVLRIPMAIIIGAFDSGATNFSRLYHKNLNKNQTDILDDVTLLWYELRLFFNFNDELLKEWISTRLPVLGGESPCAFMGAISGRNQIRIILNRMQHGDV